jgi:ribonucleotide monophosphatase NagD (HAD superfamily)
VFYAGKPYRPIYDMALMKAEAAIGRAVARRRILAVGDSVRTDQNGARRANVDFLFVASGIHADELGGERPDPQALKTVLASTGEMPKAIMRRLVW